MQDQNDTDLAYAGWKGKKMMEEKKRKIGEGRKRLEK